MPLPNTPPSPGKDKQIIRDKEMAKDEDMANEEEEVKDKGLVKDEEIEAAGQQTDNEDDDKAPCPEPEREKLSISDTYPRLLNIGLYVESLDDLYPEHPSRTRPPYYVPWEYLIQYDCVPLEPPTAPDIGPEEEVWQLVLHEYRASGRIFDAFYGGLLRPPACGEWREVVARICDPDAVPGCSACRRPFVTREQITREAQLYNNELRPLQGTVVPRSYGLYEVTDESKTQTLLVSILEDCGPQATPEDAIWSLALLGPRDKAALREAVAAVHGRGVLHGDIGPSNVVRRHDSEPDSGDLVLIDFTSAKACASQEELDAEMAKLNESLDMDVVRLPSRPWLW